MFYLDGGTSSIRINNDAWFFGCEIFFDNGYARFSDVGRAVFRARQMFTGVE